MAVNHKGTDLFLLDCPFFLNMDAELFEHVAVKLFFDTLFEVLFFVFFGWVAKNSAKVARDAHKSFKQRVLLRRFVVMLRHNMLIIMRF